MVNLPPAKMNYKCFDELPDDLRKYKQTKYRFVSCVQKEFVTETKYSKITSTKWVSLYEWWFEHRGNIYMHLNEYIGNKKGEVFDYNGRNYAKPSQAWWIDADGQKCEYEHTNRRNKR
jgi:hypothetical protein